MDMWAGKTRSAKSMVEKPGDMPRFMMMYCRGGGSKKDISNHAVDHAYKGRGEWVIWILTNGSVGMTLSEICEIGSAPTPPA